MQIALSLFEMFDSRHSKCLKAESGLPTHYACARALRTRLSCRIARGFLISLQDATMYMYGLQTRTDMKSHSSGTCTP